MPLFHNKFTAIGEPILPMHPELLAANGPVVQVQLEPPPALVASLVAAKAPVPPPVVGSALVDTGATLSCVEVSLPARLGVKPVGTTHMIGAKGGGPSSLYPLRVVVQGAKWTLDFANMAEADLAPFGLVALLGRDFLQGGFLLYMGFTGEFTLGL